MRHKYTRTSPQPIARNMAEKHPAAEDEVDILGMSPPSLKRLKEKIEKSLSETGVFLGRVSKPFLHHLHYSAESCMDALDDADEIAAMVRSVGNIVYEDEDDDKALLRVLGDEEVDTLLSTGTPSGYGCVKTATTVTDPEVRLAVEHKDHPLMREAFGVAETRIANLAEVVFGVDADSIEVRPLKVNVYPPKGHFKEHVDTPNTNPRYLGSAVVEFPTERGRTKDSGNLELFMSERDKWVAMRSLSVFMPFVRHRVTPVAEGDVRVTVSFELFRKEGEFTAGSEPLMPAMPEEEETVYNMIGRASKRFLLKKEYFFLGFICSNEYGRHQSLYGVDVEMKQSLEKHGLLVTEVPVIIEYTYIEDVKICGDVYAANKDFHNMMEDDETALFFMTSNEGMTLLSESHEEGAEYTGNESRAEAHDMKYYARALLVSLFG